MKMTNNLSAFSQFKMPQQICCGIFISLVVYGDCKSPLSVPFGTSRTAVALRFGVQRNRLLRASQ
jgi:hypothetical protein